MAVELPEPQKRGYITCFKLCNKAVLNISILYLENYYSGSLYSNNDVCLIDVTGNLVSLSLGF